MCRKVPDTSVACGLLLVTSVANFILACVALLLGLWFYFNRRSYEPLMGHQFYTLAVYVSVGTVAAVCLLSVLAAAAVLLQHRWQIVLYAVAICICAAAAGFAGIMSLFFHEKIREILDNSLNKTMAEYYGNPNHQLVTESVDLLQNSMPCCGYVLYNDWLNSNLYRDPELRNGTSVPVSCCRNEYKQDLNPRCNEGYPFPLSPRKLHQRGCLPLLESWYRQHAFIVGITACCLSGFLMISVCTATLHCSHVSSRLRAVKATRQYARL